jgi:hypothetical protein
MATMLTSTRLRAALCLSSVWWNAWQYHSPVRETWNKTQSFCTMQTGDGTWEMCRKHEHLRRANRRVANNADKFCVIVADLSQNTEFLFCQLSIQTSSGAYPAPYTVGTGSFTGLKRQGRGVDPQNHLETTSKKESSYTSSPPLCLHDKL